MIKDIHEREIQQGDEIIFLSGAQRLFQVVQVDEPSVLTPPGQVPVGRIIVTATLELPLPNPQRTENLRLVDVAIVRKFTEIPVPPGTSTQ